MSELSEVEAVALPSLDAPALAELAEFGTEVPIEAGTFLFRAGDEYYDFTVILEGHIEIVRDGADASDPVASHGIGRFLGELHLLTGQRPYLSALVTESGRILRISPAEFRRLMGSKPDLADTIFRSFVARHELLRAGDAAKAIQIIGSRYSPEFMALSAFASRSHLVHSTIDVETHPDVDDLLAAMNLGADDMPVVLTQSKVLSRPSTGEFADLLGLTYRPIPDDSFDLVVVGTGPAGLAAAVYGASEGLSTISLDAVAVGGQAGASSRIENYMGFPNGISGEGLTSNAAIQAQRLGAHLNAPCEVVGLDIEHGHTIVQLADGTGIHCRTVIIASGARYQRLPVDELERFEGAGVYYAATALEATSCRGRDVIVVGGGNSAGQAAIYLAQTGSRVAIAIRGHELLHSMSRYLIERIEAHPQIDVLQRTEVRALSGVQHLESVTLEETTTSTRRVVPCAGLFCFIGAEPATAWLGDTVALDDAGFILTDRSLPESVIDGAAFVSRRPLPFETSVPGVFAVGDVRQGSLKRVAAAVGEGSSAVRSVHDYLASIG